MGNGNQLITADKALMGGNTNEHAMDMRTPIEIALDIDENGMTTARKLYVWLELDPSHYARWYKTNITENQFAEENIDFKPFAINGECGGQATQDAKLTAHFAKKLSCKGNGERADLAREYFSTLDDKAKEIAVNRNQASPLLQSIAGLVDSLIKQEAEQRRQAEQLNRIEKKQTSIEERQEAIADTFQKADDTEDFQKWANNCISQIAESPKFNKGQTRSQNYSLARTESYERLKHKRNCRLDERVQKAIGRALEERPDIKKAELQKITKIYIIANDKDLRPAYELVIKEMMICYCVKSA